MKRELKFRAWDNQENRMITNGCLGAGSSCQIIIIEWAGGLSLCNAYGLPDGTNPTFDKPVTERFELMQFTGLKDKSGKEIYEGDIIKMGDNPECWFAPRVVEFKNGAWMGGSCRIYTNQDKHDYQGDSNQDNWEIIGNIFENPELLEAVA